jgi:exopolysaccharide/PEP-CTERM locus tyrosine autokinase
VTIDTSTLEGAGVLASIDRRHQQLADYRHIKRQVVAQSAALARSAGPAARLLMVTSALPGEGKTFTSINLALSLALERDSSVLLIDGDVARPSTSRLLGIENLPGLFDALSNEQVDVEGLVLGTNVKGLTLLPVGKASPSATEDLASGRMEGLMRQLLAVPSRYIVIDSPPLLVTTEAAATSRHAGQVVVVVHAESTLQRAVMEGLRLLGERDGVSLILNRVHHSKLEGYYYGYNYGERYGDLPIPKALGRE